MERKKRWYLKEVSSADEKQSKKSVVTTNGEKSAEVIVLLWLQTWWEGLNFKEM